MPHENKKALRSFYHKNIFIFATFHTQRPENYSICLSGQKFLATMYLMKINHLLRPFSISTEQYASKED